jgi:hypothetical protein
MSDFSDQKPQNLSSSSIFWNVAEKDLKFGSKTFKMPANIINIHCFQIQ